MAIIGILLCVGQPEADGDPAAISDVAANVTMDQAIAKVRESELTDIGFDARSAGGEDWDHYASARTRATELAWPDAPGPDGQFRLDSVWGGPLAEGGMEWRFVPVIDDALPMAA